MSLDTAPTGRGAVTRHAVPVLTADRVPEVAAQFARVLAAGAVARDAAGTAPREEVAAFGQTGLLAISVPTGSGGPGLGYGPVADVFRIVATADASVAQIVQSHFGAIDYLRTFGTPEQVRFIHQEILQGKVFGNAQAERGQRGENRLRTVLRRSGDGWVLTGEKSYTTGSFTGDWIRVSAATPEHDFVFAFVPRATPGVEFAGDWNLFGQRGTASQTVRFHDVPVPDELVLAPRPDLPEFTPLGTTFQINHAAIDIGVARGALETGRDLLRSRSRVSPEAFRHGVETSSRDPLIVESYGRLVARLHAVEALLAVAAGALDRAARTLSAEDVAAAATRVAEVKALGGEYALRIASEIVGHAGSSNAGRDVAIDRYWRDVRVHTLHDSALWRYHLSGDAFLNETAPAVLGTRQPAPADNERPDAATTAARPA